MAGDRHVDLSVVVPIYKEEDSIRPFLARLEPVLARISEGYEILFCMDPWASFHTELLSTDLDLFRREIDRSSFVLAVTTRGAGKVHPWLPSAEVADTVLEIVRSRSDFREVTALGPWAQTSTTCLPEIGAPATGA
jgi:hypothetical protein